MHTRRRATSPPPAEAAARRALERTLLAARRSTRPRGREAAAGWSRLADSSNEELWPAAPTTKGPNPGPQQWPAALPAADAAPLLSAEAGTSAFGGGGGEWGTGGGVKGVDDALKENWPRAKAAECGEPAPPEVSMGDIDRRLNALQHFLAEARIG